jgi:hypothetical protein
MKEFYRKYLLKNAWFHILTAIAIGLLIASFIVPPTGEISPTVLKGVAEIFAFASLGTVIKAIDRGGAAKIKHKDTVVEISPKKDEEEAE